MPTFFFCSLVCHLVQWCSVILIQLFLCSQVWSKVMNSFAHLVQHCTTKLRSRLLNNAEWVWPSHKVCKRKTQRAWANKMRANFPALSRANQRARILTFCGQVLAIVDNFFDNFCIFLRREWTHFPWKHFQFIWNTKERMSHLLLRRKVAETCHGEQSVKSVWRSLR